MITNKVSSKIPALLQKYNKPRRPFLAVSPKGSWRIAVGAFVLSSCTGAPNTIALPALLGFGIAKLIIGIRKWLYGRKIVNSIKTDNDKALLQTEFKKIDKSSSSQSSSISKTIKGIGITLILAGAAIVDWIATATESSASLFFWAVLGIILVRSGRNKEAQPPDTEKILTKKLEKNGTII